MRPRAELVEDDADSPEIAASIDLLAPPLLGRHVRPRARDCSLVGQLGAPGERRLRGYDHRDFMSLEALGNTEIEHHDLARVRHEDVGRLEIAVDDPELM